MSTPVRNSRIGTGARLALLVAVNLLLVPAHAACFLVALVLSLLPVYTTRVGCGNLRRIRGTGFWRARLLMLAVYLHYCWYFMELLLLQPLGLAVILDVDAFTRWLQEADGRRVRRGARGFFFFGAHFGNAECSGEAVATALASIGLPPLRVVAQPARFRVFTSLMRWCRARRRLTMIWSGGPGLVRELLAGAGRGESFALLADQKPKQSGFFIRFCGQFAAFPAAGPEICVRAGLLPVHIAARRVFPGCLRVRYAAGWGAGAADVTAAAVLAERVHWDTFAGKRHEAALVVAGYATWLEGLIDANPAQWCWDYKKWSRALGSRTPARRSRGPGSGTARQPPA